jgi:hypothetical protein
MTEHEKEIIRLSKISRFADIDLREILNAISLARRQTNDEASYEDVATQAIANLPDGISSFERGVVSGIVLAQMTSPHQSKRW